MFYWIGEVGIFSNSLQAHIFDWEKLVASISDWTSKALKAIELNKTKEACNPSIL